MKKSIWSKIIPSAALALVLVCGTLFGGCKSNGKDPVVIVEMENGKVFKMRLDAEAAPITVENFIKLVESGFYDGLTFHRVEPGFVVQGGDPKGNGTGGSDEMIKGEFASNGWNNTLKHKTGTLSMARAKDPDSASSQFFICLSDSMSVQYLDGNYAAFGEVIEGMDVVMDIQVGDVMKKVSLMKAD